MAQPSYVRQTRTFKKYKDEFRPELVEAARTLAKQQDLGFYEDASIVKITGDKSAIDALCDTLRAQHGALPGDPEPKEKKAEKKSEK